MLARLNALLLILELMALVYCVAIESWLGTIICLVALYGNWRTWVKIARRR